MKRENIITIILVVSAIMAGIGLTFVSASEYTGELTNSEVGMTISHNIISTDKDTGKVMVEFNYEINPQGKDISNRKIYIRELNTRFSGYDYKGVVGVENINQNSGTFVRELDIDKAYSLNLNYDWDGIDWDTDDNLFYS